MTIESKIIEVAGKLGVPASWLDKLINFETAGTYSPAVKNPYSSARGLIQLTDPAARDLGYTDSLEAVNAWPDFEGQMDHIVYPYLKRYMPFPTQQSLYMSVYYPAYRNMPPDTAFSEYIQSINPGIVTIQDYIDKANARINIASLKVIEAVGGSAVVLLLVAVGAYLILRGRIV